jgi:hypothetical protein
MALEMDNVTHIVDELRPLEWVKEREEFAEKPSAGTTGLGDLPESCIALILRLTAPRDVARLACVSPAFRAAADWDMVWESRLPVDLEAILAQATNAPPRPCSKTKLYDFLCNRVLLKNGTEDYWLDRATGGVCRSIGVKGLNITWGDDERYWNLSHQREGSRYSEVAYLRLVWWLEIRGKLDCFLLPGTYTLSWRMYHQFENTGPIHFTVEATDNEDVHTICYLTPEGARTRSEGGRQVTCRWDQGKWMEIDVAEFTVDNINSPLSVSFSMTEIVTGSPKEGLYLDGVVIRPQNATQNLPSGVSQSDQSARDIGVDNYEEHPLWWRRFMGRFR